MFLKPIKNTYKIVMFLLPMILIACSASDDLNDLRQKEQSIDEYVDKYKSEYEEVASEATITKAQQAIVLKSDADSQIQNAILSIPADAFNEGTTVKLISSSDLYDSATESEYIFGQNIILKNAGEYKLEFKSKGPAVEIVVAPLSEPRIPLEIFLPISNNQGINLLNTSTSTEYFVLHLPTNSEKYQVLENIKLQNNGNNLSFSTTKIGKFQLIAFEKIKIETKVSTETNEESKVAETSLSEIGPVESESIEDNIKSVVSNDKVILIEDEKNDLEKEEDIDQISEDNTDSAPEQFISLIEDPGYISYKFEGNQITQVYWAGKNWENVKIPEYLEIDLLDPKDEVVGLLIFDTLSCQYSNEISSKLIFVSCSNENFTEGKYVKTSSAKLLIEGKNLDFVKIELDVLKYLKSTQDKLVIDQKMENLRSLYIEKISNLTQDISDFETEINNVIELTHSKAEEKITEITESYDKEIEKIKSEIGFLEEKMESISENKIEKLNKKIDKKLSEIDSLNNKKDKKIEKIKSWLNEKLQEIDKNQKEKFEKLNSELAILQEKVKELENT